MRIPPRPPPERRSGILAGVKMRLVRQQAAIREQQRDRIDHMHALMHEFMRDMDRAVLIHEQLAGLEGRDPKEVNSALWPVRTRSATP